MDYNNTNQPMGQPMGQPIYVPQTIPEEYQPISMWGYLGYEILFSIPCVGFVLLLVFAFTARNVNVKNFARSYFCLFIIAAVIVAVLVAVFGIAFLEMFNF